MRVRVPAFSYGKRVVLKDVAFTADDGVTGLLGPNGAGKTTLIKLLATVYSAKRCGADIRYDEGGTADIADMRKRIGYLPQRFELLGLASVLRNVAYAAWTHGVERAECVSAAMAALEKVDLADQQRTRASALSGGMRQRLGIACAIVHQPSVLLLDEPTVGLDPVQRIGIRKLLDQIGQQACVIVSTHLIDDLTAMAAQTLILNEGKLVFQGSTATMTELGHTHPQTGMSDVESGYVHLLQGVDGAPEIQD